MSSTIAEGSGKFIGADTARSYAKPACGGDWPRVSLLFSAVKERCFYREARISHIAQVAVMNTEFSTALKWRSLWANPFLFGEAFIDAVCGFASRVLECDGDRAAGFFPTAEKAIKT
jgi:hypothetical protein